MKTAIGPLIRRAGTVQHAFTPRVWFLVVAVLLFIAIGVLSLLSDGPAALSATACVLTWGAFRLAVVAHRQAKRPPARPWLRRYD
jgi:hypothetical protein